MDALLFTEHRFQRLPDGTIGSPKHYNAEFFTERYLRVFDRIRVIARLQGGAIGEMPLSDRVTLVSVGDWHSALGYMFRRKHLLNTVRRELRSPAAVLCLSPALVVGMLAQELIPAGRPYGVEVVGDPAQATRSLRHLLRPLISKTYVDSQRKACANAAAVSYVTQHSLQKHYPTGPRGRSVACSDVLLRDEAFVAQPRRWESVGPRTICHVGTMSQPYKRQDLLIRAVATLSASGHDLRLRLVGDGDLRPQFEALAKELRVTDRVTFVGTVASGSGVRDELDRSDLCLLPSSTEGLPRALLEAMARGLPCLASKVGGLPELLADNELFAADDEAAVTNSIELLLRDVPRQNRLAARNLDFARGYHDSVLDARRQGFLQQLCAQTASYFCKEKAA